MAHLTTGNGTASVPYPHTADSNNGGNARGSLPAGVEFDTTRHAFKKEMASFSLVFEWAAIKMGGHGKRSAPPALFSSRNQLKLAGDQGRQVGSSAGIAPFIVIPCHDLDQIAKCQRVHGTED
jgi:hypothetical protein